MTGKWTDDPPRPSHLTPGRWNQICREKEAAEAQEFAKARGEGKLAAREMLKRVLKNGGPAAVDFALSLPDTTPLDEVERAATRAAATGALPHRPQGALTADRRQFEREPTKPQEEAWLKEARLEAEAAWNKMFGRPVSQRDLRTAEQIALHESFGELCGPRRRLNSRSE